MWPGNVWKYVAAAGVTALLCSPGGALAGTCTLSTFTLPVTMQGLRASVPVKVDGRDTKFWLDSGAWFSIMSQAKADELGLKTASAPFGLTMSGIGGSFTPMVTTIKDFGVVGSELHNVDFIVGGSDAGNGLIGRNLLTQADTEFDLPHGAVKIVKAKGCRKTNMAYWARGKTVFAVRLLADQDSGRIHDLNLPIMLGDTKVNAAIDSGATTLISLRAAQRAGLDLKAPGVVPLDGIGGFGRHYKKGWLVPVDKVGIGDETILHAKLAVIDGPIDEGDNAPDMLLGIDFLLAHHLYVSRNQHLIYFTYSGGNPFPVEDRTSDAKATEAASAGRAAPIPPGMRRVQAVDSTPQPKSADEFARRASSRLAKQDVDGAVADYSAAIRLAPDNAAYYRDRAETYGYAGNAAAARADFDEAIKLAPNDPQPLLARAWMRHADNDDKGALADAVAAQKLLTAASLQAASIAQLYDELGKARYAIHIYDAIIAAHRRDVRLGSLLNGRCWSRALANAELDDALSDCTKSLKLTGDAAGVVDSRALVLFRKKDFAGALEDYDAVLKENPKAAWSLYMRGMTRSALGQAEAGRADRDSALKLDPKILERAKQYGLTVARADGDRPRKPSTPPGKVRAVSSPGT